MIDSFKFTRQRIQLTQPSGAIFRKNPILAYGLQSTILLMTMLVLLLCESPYETQKELCYAFLFNKAIKFYFISNRSDFNLRCAS